MSLTSYRAAPPRANCSLTRHLVVIVKQASSERYEPGILLGLAVTYSPTPNDAVPLAQQCLTAGFGMGPGVSRVL